MRGAAWRQQIVGTLHNFGPAFLVSVAYIDPGNWATAIEGGSRFGYQLLWVVIVSNLIAILLQVLAARLGIVSGKHLAEVCREQYPQSICFLLWCLSEISILALDLSMVLGTAVGINLLSGISLVPCIFLTSLDFVVVLCTVPRIGRLRLVELLTVCIVAIVLACFIVDAVFRAPPLRLVLNGLIPNLNRESVYTAVSLLGANVMPHNFYLHSALVKGRHKGSCSVRQLCQLNLIDVALALGVALSINVAILSVSASAFYSTGVMVETLQSAHDFMEQLLTSQFAPAVFGLALILTSQLSTFTGTISGQIVLQGFLNKEISPWMHRLATRSLAIISAAFLQVIYGDRGTYKMLVVAQVVLALQLPFTLIPLIKATSDRALMGPFANGIVIQALAWSSTFLIFLVNLMLFAASILPFEQSGLNGPWTLTAISWKATVLSTIVLLGTMAGLALLLWMLLTPMTSEAVVDDRPLEVHVLQVEKNIEGGGSEDGRSPCLSEIVMETSASVREMKGCALVIDCERGLGKGSRKTFARILDGFWAPLFDLHGQAITQTMPAGIEKSLDDCLLAVHGLENAASVFLGTAGQPWNVVEQEVLSWLHVALQGETKGFVFPWRCRTCSEIVLDPNLAVVRTSSDCGEDWRKVVLMGMWSLKCLLVMCSVEPRPDLWGKYCVVLNRLQWLLPNLPISIQEKEISGIDVLVLVEEIERRILNRRAEKGTAPAIVAYPKGKEILSSIVRRYKRALKKEQRTVGVTAGSRMIGMIYLIIFITMSEIKD